MNSADEKRSGEGSGCDHGALNLRPNEPADQAARTSGEGEDPERDSLSSFTPHSSSREQHDDVSEERRGDARDLGPVAVHRQSGDRQQHDGPQKEKTHCQIARS